MAHSRAHPPGFTPPHVKIGGQKGPILQQGTIRGVLYLSLLELLRGVTRSAMDRIFPGSKYLAPVSLGGFLWLRSHTR